MVDYYFDIFIVILMEIEYIQNYYMEIIGYILYYEKYFEIMKMLKLSKSKLD